MKKQLLLIAMACCLAPLTLMAQTGQGSVYSLQTRYLIHQLDSAERAALASLLNEYHAKVTMKNEFVKSERTMFHYWTADSRELVTITEFADWSAIEKAGDRDEELEKAAWPDARQRSDFMKRMNGYFTHHRDALYNGMPGLTK
jgi:hypothetical protein